jgi:hypothetical protein
LTVSKSRLAGGRERPHNGEVGDTEATQLMLETLFELRWRVRDIHHELFGEDDNGEEEEEENA